MDKYLSNNLILQNKADLSNASVAPISNGRYIVVEETKELYYDTNNQRLKLRDIQIFDLEADRTAATHVTNNSMVYVVESNKIYFYGNGSWIECNRTVYVGTTPPTDDSVELWIDPSGSVAEIEDVLTSTSAINALSANQGRVLKEMIDAIELRLTVARI